MASLKARKFNIGDVVTAIKCQEWHPSWVGEEMVVTSYYEGTSYCHLRTRTRGTLASSEAHLQYHDSEIVKRVLNKYTHGA